MEAFEKKNIIMELLEVANCPSTESSYTNRAIINKNNILAQNKINHIAVRLAPRGKEAFIFSVALDNVDTKKIAFNYPSRKWANLQTNKFVEVVPFQFTLNQQCIHTMLFAIDFNKADNPHKEREFDVEDMMAQFSARYCDQAFTIGQLFAFPYTLGKEQVTNATVTFELTVKEIKTIDYANDETGASFLTPEIGLSIPNTIYLFEKGENSNVKLSGGPNNFSAPRVISQNWDFQSMGVGGLSEQFNKIFLRAFASRLLPPQFAEKIKAEFVKGILLYGPPGTGKTLIARQIGKMLLSREPKVVNGPEVLNKYVGESEANIRKLFQEAEDEYKKSGSNSGLHVIIFDEIDAICKSRGNSASSAGVGDNIVNQLLSKIDGVNALPNVLLIGMTNRKDLIDEALLRPGRLELQIEIGVPNQEGRLEILKIHTEPLRRHQLLEPGVSLEELAEKTKNYTGAEIAGLVRAARDIAVNRVIKADDVKLEITQEMLDSIKLKRDDFRYAMENFIKPVLGVAEDQLGVLAREIIPWDDAITTIRSKFQKIIETSQSVENPLFVLLTGEPKSGLTTLAANLALQSGFPFVRIYRSASTVGESEFSVIQALKKLFADAARSELSCVVLDDIHYIMNYSHIGPQFSFGIMKALAAQATEILPKGRKMLVIVTCSKSGAIETMGITHLFNPIIRVPSLMTPNQVQAVLNHCTKSDNCPFTANQCEELIEKLNNIPFKMGIGTVLDILTAVGKEEPDRRVTEFLTRMHELNLVIRSSRATDIF